MNEGMNEKLVFLIERLRRGFQSEYQDDGWTGIYLLELGNERPLRFRVHSGQIEALDPRGEYDCRLRCDPEDAQRLLDGSMNLVTAFLRGDVEVEGDINLAQRLHAFIRAQSLGVPAGATR